MAPPFADDRGDYPCDTCSYCVNEPPAGNPREDCGKTRTAYDVHGECWTPAGCMLVWSQKEVEW